MEHQRLSLPRRNRALSAAKDSHWRCWKPPGNIYESRRSFLDLRVEHLRNLPSLLKCWLVSILNKIMMEMMQRFSPAHKLWSCVCLRRRFNLLFISAIFSDKQKKPSSKNLSIRCARWLKLDANNLECLIPFHNHKTACPEKKKRYLGERHKMNDIQSVDSLRRHTLHLRLLKEKGRASLYALNILFCFPFVKLYTT